MFGSAYRFALSLALLLVLAACVPIPQPEHATASPRAVEYDLGETTITQARFPEDSRFRNMPVRLNGVIAAPEEGAGPFPVILILHGTHPGCPEIDHVDRWPCDVADERPNYRGFAYLAERLAAHGYVALSININAENTFGFGEPAPGERLEQIVAQHLRSLATASAGGENKFGVNLKGKADLKRLALAGHSRGGEMAYMLAHDEHAVAYAGANGYGPVAGILMIAPSPGFVDPAAGASVPLGILLPLCDADVINQEGQHFYEGARLAPEQRAWVASAFIERANHNFFNSTLGDDPFGRPGRPDCKELLDPQAQQAFLGDYAVDFFATLFGDATASKDAMARLGMDPGAAASSELYAKAARVAVLPSAADRTVLFTPAALGELTTNRLGGAVKADGVTTLFCEAGYYTPTTHPGTEPCRRATVVLPGDPALAVVSWEKPGAALRFEIP
jgi:dienelactone hydrolase